MRMRECLLPLFWDYYAFTSLLLVDSTGKNLSSLSFSATDSVGPGLSVDLLYGMR